MGFLIFLCGTVFGGFLGVVIMCCMQIGKIKDNKKGAVKKQSKKSEVHGNPWVSDNFFIKNRYLRRNFKIVLFLGYKE